VSAFLRELAVLATDWPYTEGEIWYGQTMQDCFWSLVRQKPALSSDEPASGEELSDVDAAEGLTFCVLLAMMSASRGRYHAAADVCRVALAYMASLPAWRDVRLDFASDDDASLSIDLTKYRKPEESY
jgi:hypothetical protein